MPRKARRQQEPTPPEGSSLRALHLLVAFCAGWAIMMLEIVGGRVLAPYFGYSVYQWGALIGVVMVALSLGYWLGGRVGDSPKSRRTLLIFLLAATGWAALQPLLAATVVPASRGLGPAWGAVVASAGLLGPVSLFLAAVSPMVIRLTLAAGVARAAGGVYAVSTLGSIGGTFFAAFYAIPTLGSRWSQVLVAVMLALTTAALALAQRRLAPAAAALLLTLLALPGRAEPPPGVIFEAETLHNLIRVVDDGSTRALYLNYTDSPQSLMRRGSLLTGYYFDTFLLGPAATGGRRVLVLGVAGGVALRQIAEIYPGSQVTGVDLDPVVLDVAREHFGLAGHPRIDLEAADARWYLESSEARFDVIAVDLFVTGQVPYFCATREFFEAAARRLAPGGLLMMNVASRRGGRQLLGPFVRTLGSAFPSVFELVHDANHILIASGEPLDLATLERRIRRGARDPRVRWVAAEALPRLRTARPDPAWPLFTDDRSDVELRSFRAQHGG